MSIYNKLRERLAKTRENIAERVGAVILNRKIDDSLIEELEEILIASDIGAGSANEIIHLLKEGIKKGEVKNADDIKTYLMREMSALLGSPQPLVIFGEKPFVILAIGVNGAGKTTTIGKLASRLISDGNSVIIAAADTFRAAAIEQLEIWAERTGAEIVKHQSGSDPA
ncbi:MAG: signal recognition particle receptor subunit alpha, partial [Nitrospirae bacterium]|nr:signal recognition particle receptor subunit alpha [Nitrospirota bacterium]